MSSPRASALLLPVIYLGFISLGLPDGTLGVAWPQMHQSLHLPLGLAGALMMVGTLLSAGSSFSSAAIQRRVSTGMVVLVSCALTGSGLLIISQAPGLGWLALAILPLGLGAGAVDASLNGFVARHYSGRHMNWLHACWGIGATCGPLLMARAVAEPEGWRLGYLTIGSMQWILALVFICTLRLWKIVPARPPATIEGAAAARTPMMRANSEAGLISAGIFALYVAVESTTGLWAASILVESRGVAADVAGLCATAYYGSITAGRVLVGFMVERFSNRRMVTLGLMLALGGITLFLFANTTWLAAIALVLLGLGFAPVYPGMMHEVPRRFAPDAALTVIGRQSSAAYLGGAFVPAMAGGIAEAGSLEAIAWAVLGGTGLLAASVWRLNRIT